MKSLILCLFILLMMFSLTAFTFGSGELTLTGQDELNNNRNTTNNMESFALKETGMNNAQWSMVAPFIENGGQISDSSVRYYLTKPGKSIFLTDGGLVIDLFKHETTNKTKQRYGLEQSHIRRNGIVIKTSFIDSQTTGISGEKLLPGKVNFFIGKDKNRWHTGLPTYREVVYREVYPGIDLRYSSVADKLKYQFEIAQSADPENIKVRLRGIDFLTLDNQGNLIITTKAGKVIDEKPFAYQIINETVVQVDARFKLINTITYGFSISEYNPANPLIIDPGLLYSTYLGGADDDDSGSGIVADVTGNAYVTGITHSVDFPTTLGAYNTVYNGSGDVFVSKLSPDGSTLLFSTYIGGSNEEGFGLWGTSISLDNFRNIFVAGSTYSDDFPTTGSAYDKNFNGIIDVFVLKLNSTGTTLLFSTFLGGDKSDYNYGIEVDNGGDVYITGSTESSNFPVSPGTFDPSYNLGTGDVYVSKLSADGSSLLYSTYLGGTDIDIGRGIAVDGIGNIYVTGETQSPEFPTTSGAFLTYHRGGTDMFISKFNPSGSSLLYSTFLGGSGDDYGYGLALDIPGNAYVTGETNSASDFSATLGAFDNSFNGVADAFIAKFNPDGSSLLFATYLGGTDYDYGDSIALDTMGNPYITGMTRSGDFPTGPGAFDPVYNDMDDVFVSKISADGSTLLYSTYIGGTFNETGTSIFVDSIGDAYVTGITDWLDFPVTLGVFDPSYNDWNEVFVCKLSLETPTPTTSPTVTSTSVVPTNTPYPSSTPYPTYTLYPTYTIPPSTTPTQTPTNTTTSSPPIPAAHNYTLIIMLTLLSYISLVTWKHRFGKRLFQ